VKKGVKRTDPVADKLTAAARRRGLMGAGPKDGAASHSKFKSVHYRLGTGKNLFALGLEEQG
jgi:hypothetical protein